MKSFSILVKVFLTLLGIFLVLLFLNGCNAGIRGQVLPDSFEKRLENRQTCEDARGRYIEYQNEWKCDLSSQTEEK